jgi:hypothetical protein
VDVKYITGKWRSKSPAIGIAENWRKRMEYIGNIIPVQTLLLLGQIETGCQKLT